MRVCAVVSAPGGPARLCAGAGAVRRICSNYWPAADRALKRVRYAGSQVSANREERKKNIVGAFAFNDAQADAVRDRRVLLIDDVLTTGATVCECARVLYAAGARRVLALTACLVK